MIEIPAQALLFHPVKLDEATTRLTSSRFTMCVLPFLVVALVMLDFAGKFQRRYRLRRSSRHAGAGF